MTKLRFTLDIPKDIVERCMVRDHTLHNRWYGSELRFAKNWLIGVITSQIRADHPTLHYRLDEPHVIKMEEIKNEKDSDIN